MSSTELIETPVSRILIPYRGRWGNALYVREYQRMKRHDKFPSTKTRTMLDSTSVRLADTYTYYQRSTRLHCDVCQKDVYQGSWQRHITSHKHQKKLIEDCEQGLETIGSPETNYVRP
jgi:hypothetical protein